MKGTAFDIESATTPATRGPVRELTDSMARALARKVADEMAISEYRRTHRRAGRELYELEADRQANLAKEAAYAHALAELVGGTKWDWYRTASERAQALGLMDGEEA